jgi:hypothetical protein
VLKKVLGDNVSEYSSIWLDTRTRLLGLHKRFQNETLTKNEVNDSDNGFVNTEF